MRVKILFGTVLLVLGLGIVTKISNAEEKASTSFHSFKEAYAAADALFAEAKWMEAAELYAQAEKHASTDKGKSQASNAQGYALLKARKYQEAVDAFSRAVQADPSNLVALSNLGYAYHRLYVYRLVEGLEPLVKAESYLKLAEQIDPNYKPELLQQVVSDLEREKLYAQATPIAQKPTPGMGYKAAVALGDQAQEQGQFDLAVEAFVLAEKEAHSSRAKASAANRAGKVYLDSRRPKEAIAHFQQAVEYDPKEKVFLNNLGFAYWMFWDSGRGTVEDLKKAVALFYQVNEWDPTYRPGNFRMALETLREAAPEAAKEYEIQETREKPSESPAEGE